MIRGLASLSLLLVAVAPLSAQAPELVKKLTVGPAALPALALKYQFLPELRDTTPGNAALFYMMNLYKEAFVYYRMGYASALAWALFAVGLIITIALFASAKRWVYYASEER